MLSTDKIVSKTLMDFRPRFKEKSKWAEG